MKSTLLLLLLVVASCAAQKVLRQAVVVCRHGERTPFSTYPNDPYTESTFSEYGMGQLTDKGKKNQEFFGQYLRKRYSKLLGDNIGPNNVYGQCTETDRTYQSLAALLKGLSPEYSVPFKYSAWDEDILVAQSASCPRYKVELKKVYNVPEVRQLLHDNQGLFQELTHYTGQDIENPDGVNAIYSTLEAEEAFDLKLPSWTNKYYPEKLTPMSAKSFILDVYTDLMIRLKGGPLLRKILSDFTKKAQSQAHSKDRKMFIYAGHDFTVVNVMRAFGVWPSNSVPRFGVTFLVELYEDVKTKEFGVQVYLKDSVNAPSKQLTIPGCGKYCPLSQLIQLRKKVIPSSWSQECSN